MNATCESEYRYMPRQQCDNNDIMYYSFSSFPALCYYAEHGYTDQDEVNIPLLKRNFGM